MNNIIPVSIVIFFKERTDHSVKLWCQTRQSQGTLHGLWEFPGGKIEAGENPEQAALRELGEEVDPQLIEMTKLDQFKIHPYSYEGNNICLYIFLCSVKKDMEILDRKGKWFEFDFDKGSQALKGEIPPENHRIIDELLEFLKVESYGIN
ncbi:MAG: NUDIX domain-containing protein [Bacteriovoracaceae bacterium]